MIKESKTVDGKGVGKGAHNPTKRASAADSSKEMGGGSIHESAQLGKNPPSMKQGVKVFSDAVEPSRKLTHPKPSEAMKTGIIK